MFSKNEAMKAFDVVCDINADDTPKTISFYHTGRMITIFVFPSETKCGIAKHVTFSAWKSECSEKYECDTTAATYDSLDELLKAVKDVEALYE